MRPCGPRPPTATSISAFPSRNTAGVGRPQPPPATAVSRCGAGPPSLNARVIARTSNIQDHFGLSTLQIARRNRQDRVECDHRESVGPLIDLSSRTGGIRLARPLSAEISGNVCGAAAARGRGRPPPKPLHQWAIFRLAPASKLHQFRDATDRPSDTIGVTPRPRQTRTIRRVSWSAAALVIGLALPPAGCDTSSAKKKKGGGPSPKSAQTPRSHWYMRESIADNRSGSRALRERLSPASAVEIRSRCAAETPQSRPILSERYSFEPRQQPSDWRRPIAQFASGSGTCGPPILQSKRPVAEGIGESAPPSYSA
jgi:hypothetical protein